MTEKREFFAPEYYEGFRCKMGACRAACCEGWPVDMSRRDYFRLESAECSRKLRQRIDRALRVLPREIEITAGSARKRFDGAPLTCDAWALSAGALAQGDVLESVRVTGSQSGVGESENLPDAAVIRSAGGTDVTDSYAITYVCGTLCVADGGSGD